MSEDAFRWFMHGLALGFLMALVACMLGAVIIANYWRRTTMLPERAPVPAVDPSWFTPKTNADASTTPVSEPRANE